MIEFCTNLQVIGEVVEDSTMSLAAKFPFAAAFLGMIDHSDGIRGQLFTDDVRRMQRHRARLGIPSLGGSLSRTKTR